MTNPARVQNLLFRLAPTFLVIGLFSLGFLGRPEDSSWLNASPLWGEGDPFYWEGNRALASPLLIWRGNPNHEGSWPYFGVSNHYRHNALGLRDDEIDRPKRAGTFRILNVGDSATWGLSLPSRADTYSDQLERLLGSRDAEQRFDVVNAGTIGYSSLQVLQFLRYEIDALEPDLVTVYVGNNDPGPSGTRDADRIAAVASPLQRLLSKNFFSLLLQKGWLALGASRLETDRQQLIERLQPGSERAAVFASKAEFYRTLARVSPQEYEENLRELVAVARSRDVPVVLFRVPMNLLWPGVVDPDLGTATSPAGYWLPVHIAEGYLAEAGRGNPPCDTPLLDHPYLCRTPSEVLLSRWRAAAGRGEDAGPEAMLSALARSSHDPGAPACQRMRDARNRAVALIALDRVEEAAGILEPLAAGQGPARRCSGPRQRAGVRYTLGIARLLQGDRAAAREALLASRRLWPFSMSPDYLDRFERVVRGEEVEWIDLSARFAEADAAYFGSALIHDWVHPDPRGNAVIADALARWVEVRAGRRPARDPRDR